MQLSSSYGRVLFWGLLAFVSLVWNGPKMLQAWQPPKDTLRDFAQEWLSAKNYFAGFPVYELQSEGVKRHCGPEWAEAEMKIGWNAHPPVSILFALPFASFQDYHAAHLGWNLIGFGSYVFAITLILRELAIRWEWWSIFPALTNALWSQPLLGNLDQGQLTFPLVLFITVGWLATRRDQHAFAGIALGTAAAMKLFPGLFLIYFLALQRWRSVGWLVGTAIVWNLIAVSLFGVSSFHTYVHTVLPTLDIFRADAVNVSIAGGLRRLAISLGQPNWASGMAISGQILLMIGLVAQLRCKTDPSSLDRGFLVTLIVMLLASPIAWTHYFVLLVLPGLVLWKQLLPGTPRTIWLVLIVLLNLPHELFLVWSLGEETTRFLIENPGTLPSGFWLGGSPFTLGLITLAGLCAWAPWAHEPGLAPKAEPHHE